MQICSVTVDDLVEYDFVLQWTAGMVQTIPSYIMAGQGHPKSSLRMWSRPSTSTPLWPQSESATVEIDPVCMWVRVWWETDSMYSKWMYIQCVCTCMQYICNMCVSTVYVCVVVCVYKFMITATEVSQYSKIKYEMGVPLSMSCFPTQSPLFSYCISGHLKGRCTSKAVAARP